jgi:hypothetical protein
MNLRYLRVIDSLVFDKGYRNRPELKGGAGFLDC